jgi:thiol-disulfide isomerase/thioredoxin
MKKVLVIFLSACTGILFILSAYFKLWPIEPFEYKIVGTTFFGWQVSVFVARIVIATEFALGAMLLFSYRLKSTLRMTIGLLVIFCMHLGYVLISKGNSTDCGCMGTFMALTPVQGLLKNLLMIAVCIFLYRARFDFELGLRHMPEYIFITSIVSVFIVNPVDFEHSRTYLNRPFETFELDLDTIYNSTHSATVEAPPLDVRQGKYLLAFMSSSCPHCRIAAQKLSVISQRNPAIPMYFFINGDDKDIRKFVEETETSHIPHSRLGRDLFIPLAGLHLPVLFYYNRGKIDKQVDYFTLEQYHIEDWLLK